MESIGELLKTIPVVLASASPRRLRILREFGVEPVVLMPECSEKVHTELTSRQLVMALAFRKGEWAVEYVENNPNFGDKDMLIISADTVVDFEGRVLGKPASKEHAFEMLHAMSGKMNCVYSGVSLYRRKTREKLLFCDSTRVYFKPYTDSDVLRYINTYEVMDKSGSYGIQDGFGEHVERIDGYSDTVMGFPLERLLEL